MKIEVGVYKNLEKESISNSDGWMIVCEQEKIPHKLTNKPDCPVIVCDVVTPDWFPEFMEDGGVGVVTGCYPSTLPFDTRYVADASIEFIDLVELDSSNTRVACNAKIFNGKGLGKFFIHENRETKGGIIQDQFPVFIYQSYGRGGCWYSGLPLTKLLTVMGDTLRNNEFTGEYTERIVSIDRHNIIRALRNILIRSFNMRDLPYVHLWYYPNDYDSVFTFRVDVDGVFGENLINLSSAALSNDLKLTFFLNKNLCKHDEELILKIDDRHEIGNHADIHNLYTDYTSNYENIDNCKQWIDQLGINSGLWFAAPRGMWNYQLHQALDDLGYLYTSDFGCAIAGYPYYPYVFGNRSRTLQIPVNPFSAERASIWMLEKYNKELTPEFVAKSFSRIINDCYHQNYPIILYSHPEVIGTMANYVFGELNKDLKNLNVWKTTVTEFAKWWSHRDNYEYEIDYDQKTKEIIMTGNLDSKICIKEVISQ